MLDNKWLIIGSITLVLLNVSCSRSDDENISTTKDTKNESLEDTVMVEPEAIEIRGNFKRSFEIHELESEGQVYYVSDPKQLLVKHSENNNQKGYYQFFSTCVIGVIDTEGYYGPTSKYDSQITVHRLCA